MKLFESPMYLLMRQHFKTIGKDFCPLSISAKGQGAKYLIIKLHGAEKTASGIYILVVGNGIST